MLSSHESHAVHNLELELFTHADAAKRVLIVCNLRLTSRGVQHLKLHRGSQIVSEQIQLKQAFGNICFLLTKQHAITCQRKRDITALRLEVWTVGGRICQKVPVEL